MRRALVVSLLLGGCAKPPVARPELPAHRPELADPPGLGIPEPAVGPHTIYLANAGVKLDAEETGVLIDGLHRPYKPEYAVLDAWARDHVERAQGDFAAVALVLVSHVHRDHFDAEAVRRHLGSNPGARLISSQQVVDAVLEGVRPDSELHTRVEAVPYAPGQSHRREVGRITVELIGLPHGSARFAGVQNLGHIVTLGGRTALHVGDTEIDEPALVGLDLPARGLDVAFLPYWHFLGEGGAAAVERVIGARRYYAIHLPPNDPEARAALLRAAPAAVPLVEPWSQAPR